MSTKNQLISKCCSVFIGTLLILTFSVLSYTDESQKTVAPKTSAFKKFELSGSFSLSVDTYSGDPSAKTTWSASFRTGFFFTRELELEVEVTTVNQWHNDYYSSDELGLVNIAANFDFSPTVKFFILGGAGILSHLPASHSIFGESYFTYDAGTGIKWFWTPSVAGRVEYRFTSYTEQSTSYFNHRIYFGFSFFF